MRLRRPSVAVMSSSCAARRAPDSSRTLVRYPGRSDAEDGEVRQPRASERERREDGIEGAHSARRSLRQVRRRDGAGRPGRRRSEGEGNRDLHGRRGAPGAAGRALPPLADRERAPRREPEFAAPPPQVTITIPDSVPDPEPRKWQPPAPTVAPAAAERKGGWWSKR